MTVARKSVWASTLFAVILGTVGCGGSGSSRGAPSASVEGTVTFNGAGVAKGTVNFFQKDSGFAASTEINGGAFKFSEKLPTGNYSVYVAAPSITEAPEPGKAPPKLEDPKDIPAKYRDQQTSTLTAELKSGGNKVPLELTP